jgi:hypothetical protein
MADVCSEVDNVTNRHISWQTDYLVNVHLSSSAVARQILCWSVLFCFCPVLFLFLCTLSLYGMWLLSIIMNRGKQNSKFENVFLLVQLCVRCNKWQCIIWFSFITWTKSEIINADFFFILMHNINFRKLIGGGGAQGWMLSHDCPDYNVLFYVADSTVKPISVRWQLR